MTQAMIRTFRFDVSARGTHILNAAAGRLKIRGLEQSSFSYDVPKTVLGAAAGPAAQTTACGC